MIWIITGIVVATSVFAVIRMGQIQAEPTNESDNTTDQCWFLAGQIYYNPVDPVLIVEKRFGIGYTINFGNKLAWIIVALVPLIALAPVILFK